MPAHMHSSQFWFACEASPLFVARLSRLCVRARPWDRQVPRAPLRAPGVTHCAATSSVASAGVTPPSSLIRTHAPDQNPPADFGFPYFGRSLQVVASPCWELALPGVISAILAWVLGPLPRSAPSVHLLVSSRRASASPQTAQVRRARQPPQCSFNDVNISGLQSFLYVQAPILARPPGCTHRCGSVSTGRPGRLRHAMNMWLPNMNRGIATRLYRAIGATGLSPAGLRPCRPLPLSLFLRSWVDYGCLTA